MHCRLSIAYSLKIHQICVADFSEEMISLQVKVGYEQI